ncbi:MAG: putative DNA-binding domain-containing protein [Sandaracinaceae bacterium]|nr:putative DNA-binding domain-containing protein [Sandaracinaceae bacterium]
MTEPSLVEVQRAFSRICLDATPAEADLALLHGPRERWLLYRRMVRSRLFGMVRSGLPRTVATVGEARLDAAMRAYLAERGVTSRYIRDCVQELAAHALPTWSADPALPPHLADLVRYEATKWQVGSLEWVEPAPVVEPFDFEGVPVHNPTVRAVEVRFRVDRDDARRDEPVAEPHRVLLYRRPRDARVFGYALDARASALYDAWCVPERTFADGARAVLAARGAAPEPTFVDALAGLLADLVERAIIVGSRR